MAQDFQRQRVYKAERIWGASLPTKFQSTLTIPEAQKLADKVCRKFNKDPVGLSQNKRLQQWAGWYVGSWPARIEFKRANPTMTTVVHEIAHHVARDSEGHGYEFTAAMLKVVAFTMSEQVAANLAIQYVGAKCELQREQRTERIERKVAAQDRLSERDGEEKVCYTIGHASYRYRADSDVADRQWGWNYLNAFPGQWNPLTTRSTLSAKIWTKESTAAKWVAKMEERYGPNYTFQVIEMDAYLSANEHRWIGTAARTELPTEATEERDATH